MKVLLAVLVTILVIVLILVGVVGYMGFMPGISDMLGTNKPKDLGVTFTPADLKSFQAKHTVIVEPYTPTASNNSVLFSGLHAVNAAFTSAELTAAAAVKNAFYPLTNVQVKITNDIMEVSGKIMTGRIGDYAKFLGIPQDRISAVTGIVNKFPANPAAYIKGKFEMVNNKITKFDIQEATIGKLSVVGQIMDNANGVRSAIEEAIGYQKSKLDVTSLKLEGGLLKFVGKLSDKISYPLSK
jgi:hypothetical protein